ncbi:uncharacterized protein PHACADRAFT_95303 [Phanerochaete carnosa HHB-10118-sp]|uniref:Uncharacterized protein n=1 Tax=Phanerochaete carnosa (strain HHB-10118-sp) TaxID=650164 RepID=K5W8L7_PHACS|nr:uncharacterized protein PHACADRAFT_95303 [Phanerochaete carnosa HHB-10118-sp]EKM55540.1 hypothetical protein PHACADRAFT_95303 [Phanerochaete carnosa HHB-10118-sp]
MADNVAQPLPAHKTKHLAVLEYLFKNSVFRLAQLDDGNTNGTALWMGAQVLSAWLSCLLDNKYRARQTLSPKRPTVLELGSGIGLSALVASSFGWNVLATDLPDVIDSVLAENISKNVGDLPPESGTIELRALDWAVSPSEWTWADNAIIASADRPPCSLAPPFDLIITADTVYSPHLVDPLLRTLDHIYTVSTTLANSGKVHRPSLYVCVERRDPMLVDDFLAKASKIFTVSRIPPRKVADAMEKSGILWCKEDWDGMEIWSFAKARKAGEVV